MEGLRSYSADLSCQVAAGRGLWFAGMGDHAEAACAFLAGEALRREIPVLLYPGDELIGRFRRLAAEGSSHAWGVEAEIYEKLARIDLLLITDLDAAAATSRFPEKAGQDGFSEEKALEHKEGLYEPGMTETDLSRLFQVLDERLMNERATVITTTGDIPALEETLLRVPGEWPIQNGQNYHDLRWDEARHRASNLRRLVSRLVALCGPPLSPQPRSIKVYRKASERSSMLAE